MTYADNYNIRTTSVKFNDVADALDGLITRNYAGVTTGTSTAYIATPTPAWDAYTTSGLVVIIPHVTNTGAATLNISGLGARDLRIGNAAIAAGVLQQNIPAILAYTGTYFEVLLQNISIPPGTIYTYAGSSSPSGYLLCDGTEVNRITYAALFGIIGTTYGAGNTTTTFNLPDLRRRVPIGRGASDTLGGSDGGAYISRSISHSHTVPAHFHGMGTGADLNITSSGGGGATSIESATHTHTIPWVTTTLDKAWTVAGGGGAGYNEPGTTTTSTDSVDHTHTIPNHTHGTASFAGRIGRVTGGVDGNASMTSGVSTQPYLFINYIIKT